MVSVLLIGCAEKSSNCKKDQKRIKKERKSGSLKNW
jgi:hypothetical protein